MSAIGPYFRHGFCYFHSISRFNFFLIFWGEPGLSVQFVTLVVMKKKIGRYKVRLSLATILGQHETHLGGRLSIYLDWGVFIGKSSLNRHCGRFQEDHH